MRVCACNSVGAAVVTGVVWAYTRVCSRDMEVKESGACMLHPALDHVPVLDRSQGAQS